MHFSLMRLRRLLVKASYAGPAMAAAVPFAMLFALTSCCEAHPVGEAQPRLLLSCHSPPSVRVPLHLRTARLLL